MNWMQQLAETYENCRTEIGRAEDGKRPLLPICHITVQAHVEIVIDSSGRFLRANLIADKQKATTIIPSTEASASRAGSKPESHPLCDKLQYVAGDFTAHGGEVTSGFAKDPEEPFRNYITALRSWCDSEYSHPKAQAILKYVGQRTVMRDLIGEGILLLGPDGKLRAKDGALDKGAQNIFTVIDRQDGAVVRWLVEDASSLESAVWRDPSLWESWIKHYLSSKATSGLCFVSGELSALSGNHPKYVRWEGDGAKLISANDTSNFTFRGRFANDAQACGVGLEASHKAHYALSWLIDRQGYSKDGLVVVAWAKSGAAVPQPTDGSFQLFGDAPAEEPTHAYTAQDLAIRLKNRIAGYGKALQASDQVIVVALDAATTGRLALTYYRDLSGSDFLERVDNWHASCSWLHRYEPVETTDPTTGKVSKRYMPFVGAPAPRDIAAAAYGSRVDDKLRKATVQRILPCIIDDQPIPHDLVISAVRRASNRTGTEGWEWNKTLSIACALFRKANTKEAYSMALDTTRTTRDYLYGRLLALADGLEEWALRDAKENRETNAARLMQRFAEHPCTTWRTIELALMPYKARLGGKAWKLLRMIDEVVSMFAPEDFINDKPLSGEFLLGYHSQREALRPAQGGEDSKSEEQPQLLISNPQ